MISIKIGSAEASVQQADEGWVNQQINRRRAEGAVVCVQVNIDEPDVRMALSTPTCARGGGGGRPPNAREQRIFDLWRQRGLDSGEFNGGSVVSFLHQLQRLL